MSAITSKKPRRLGTVVALGLSAAIAITGCSAGGSSSTSTEAKEDIHIGGMLSFTAAGTNTGPEVAAGAVARFAKENEAGGIDGHKLVFDTADDAFDPAKAPAAMRTLVEEKNVLATLGSGSADGAAVLPYLQQNDVFSISGGSSTSLITPVGSTYRLDKPTYDELAARVVEYAVKVRGLKKIAIAYTPDAVGLPILEGARQELKKLGLAEVAAVEYSPRATSADAQAAQLKESGADFVVINHIPSVTSLIFKAAQKIDFTPTYGATFASISPALTDIMGSTLDKKIIFATSLVDVESDEASEYRKYMASTSEIDYRVSNAISAWTAAESMIAVLKKAVKAADGGLPTRKQVLAAATDITIKTTYVPGITWSKTDFTGPDASRILELQKGGKYVEIDGVKPNPISSVVPGFK